MAIRPFRLAWATDLHLDQADAAAADRLADALRRSAPDAVLVTGDLGSAPDLPQRLAWLGGATGAPTHVVLGNHDFWGGGLFDTRLRVAALCAADPRLVYLTWTGPIPLTPRTALVGHDGWYDGRAGNWQGTRLALRDFRLIDELARRGGRTDPTLGALVRALADRSVAELAPALDAAVTAYRRVIVATHVPPWWDAAMHGPSGQRCHPDLAPFLVNTAMGRLLERTADAHPGCDILVLAGHTHGATELQVRPNLRCRVGAATYGTPRVADVLDLD